MKSKNTIEVSVGTVELSINTFRPSSDGSQGVIHNEQTLNEYFELLDIHKHLSASYVYVLKGVILTDDGKYLIENNRCVKSTPGYIGKVETILYKLEDKPNRWMLQVWFYGKKFDKLYWYNFDINNGKIWYNGTGLQHRDREICTLIFNLYKYPDKEEDTDLKNVKSEEVSTRRTILVKNL